MSLLSYEFNSLSDLFLHEIKDIYDAEQRLTDAIPQMAEAATNPELRQAFSHHLGQTRQHVSRLEKVFQMLGYEPQRETCAGMKGLIAEGQDIIKSKGNDATRDAGLIAAAQKVEHYEIASYGSIRSFARELGMNEIADTLQQTLDEEGEADKKLSQIAESRVNLKAQSAEV